MPPRRDIDPETVRVWAMLYLGVAEGGGEREPWSLNEVAREYNVSRTLVKDRLEEFQPGITSSEPNAGPAHANTSAREQSGSPRANGHGDALGIVGLS